MMKKSTFGAALAFLAAASGVLAAVAISLYRREKELDEYEELLFSDDEDELADDEDEEETVYEDLTDTEPAEDGQEAPAEDGQA